MKIGNVEITSVLDASASGGASLIFPTITKEQWAPWGEYAKGPDLMLALSMTSFVVRSGGKTILVDTGMGQKDRPYFPRGRLFDALPESGVQPDDIDIVIVTHIHVDHVGGHTVKQGDGWAPAFPKAKHIFAQKEWEYWTQPEVANNPANPFVVDCVLPLEGKADIDLVPGDYKVTDETTMLPTPGHTPAHSSFMISSGGESAVILGDVAHFPVQVTEGWSGVFDVDPAKAAETRAALMDRLADEGQLVVAGHFPFPGFGRIVRVDGRRYWRGL